MQIDTYQQNMRLLEIKLATLYADWHTAELSSNRTDIVHSISKAHLSILLFKQMHEANK